MKFKITRAKIGMLLGVLLFICGTSFGAPNGLKANPGDDPLQQETVSGTVTDEGGEALPGVNVTVQGTTTGTVTNANGEYSLQVPSGDASLVFSFVGYQNQTVAVNNRSTINVTLQSATEQLDEVVVVGYGTQQRRDVTGSMSMAESEDLEIEQVETFDQAMQGKLPGVNVTTGNHSPGGGMAINVRGTGSISAGGSPLYVIDGTPLTDVQGGGLGGGFAGSNPLANLSPQNIASMKVLKGAAATAIYGSRGSNGVVLIETKEGVAGEQTINYQGSVQFSGPSNKLEFVDAKYHARLINEANELGGNPKTFTEQEISEMGEGTDWQDAVFRKPAISQKHQISASGGDEDLRYYLSGNMTDNEGIVKGSGLQRYGLQINTNANVTDNLHIEENLSFNRTYIDHSETGSKGYGSQGNMMSQILNTSPIIPLRNDEGGLYDPRQHKVGGDWDNPLFTATQYVRESRDWRILGNVNATYDITDELNIEGGFNMNYEAGHYGQYWPIGSRAASNGPGEAQWSEDESYNYQARLLAHYKGNLAPNHRLNLTGGYTYEKTNNMWSGQYVAGFPTDAFKFYNMGAAQSIWGNWSGSNGSTLLSYLGRASYTYNDTYTLGLSGRYDGASQFGRNDKWGFFPSVSLGWRLSNEAFMAGAEAFDELKLRLSWGQTGNSRIGVYESLSLIDYGQGYAFGTNDRGGQASNATPGGVPNPDLGWEEATDYNVGLDIGLFESRIFATLDAYYQKTTDLILGVPLPEQSGYSGVDKNIGAMENKGIEFSLTTRNVTGGEFSWNSRLNLSSNKNKILDLGGQKFFYTGWAGGGNVGAHGRQVARIQEGKPVGMFYGSVMHENTVWESQQQIDEVGTMPSARPGDYRFVDTNGDGTFTFDDDVFTGNPNPDLVYGFTNDFSYGNFSFRLFFQGTVGNDVLMVTKNELAGGTNLWKPDRDKRWTPENPQGGPDVTGSARAGYPNLVTTENTYDGSFLRVKTARLAYNIPSGMIGGINNASIYVRGENILTFTGYPGWDPEVNAATGSNLVKGVDRFPYPAPRSVRVGVNLGF